MELRIGLPRRESEGTSRLTELEELRKKLPSRETMRMPRRMRLELQERQVRFIVFSL
jgi:hypothetical protein